MKDRNELYRKFYALLREQKLENQKQVLVNAYGVESLGDLTEGQLLDLISKIDTMQAKVISGKRKPTSRETRKKRSVLLDLLTKLGVYKDNGDWGAVNAYMLNPRIAGKLIYEMSDHELDQCARKLRMILRKQIKDQEEKNYQAANN